MSAERLRAAAALMRERAEAATPGPWEFPQTIHGDPYVNEAGRGVLLGNIAECSRRDDYGRSNATHIASWHPAVALAVADWLDGVAGRVEAKIAHGAVEKAVWSHEIHALAVADAYLGDPR